MPIIKLRNPVAASPVLRKGGAHLKSKSSQRALRKKDTKQAVTEWKQEKGRGD